MPSKKRHFGDNNHGSEDEDQELDDIEFDQLSGDDQEEDRVENEEDYASESDGDDEAEDGTVDGIQVEAEVEELALEYKKLRNQEQDILETLRSRDDGDLRKGQCVKNQKALWDKSLEFRILLQKPFASSNKLPSEHLKSIFCGSSEGVNAAYSELLGSSIKTLEALVELQDALFNNDPSFSEYSGEKNVKTFEGTADKEDQEWALILKSQRRLATFRDKSIDKWYRKTQVTTGSAAIKQKLLAFNQNISDQVSTYMRDPSRMLKQMQLRRSTVGVLGHDAKKMESMQAEENDEDPELIDDSDFYQQLLKEFLESVDPENTEKALYAIKQSKSKKRKLVDRKASKSRKIRYNVHEKLVNFMAPRPMNLPDMAPKLFANLFGLKTQNRISANSS